MVARYVRDFKPARHFLATGHGTIVLYGTVRPCGGYDRPVEL